MSLPEDYAAHLGSPGDWGLNAESFTPLRDELADHLHCLAEDGGTDASCVVADRVSNTLASPQSRRALTATRIADQVYVTLHRRPTRQEWHELGWLGLWYVLIVLSDLLSIKATEIARSLYWQAPTHNLATDQLGILWSAWFLQGLARAGFYTTFGLTLVRAYRIGWGVLIARIFQLKLLHTVLVIVAGVSLGAALSQLDWGGFEAYDYVSGPSWLNMLAISGVLLVAALTLLLFPRARPISSIAVLLALFLYSGGPVTSQEVVIQRTWIKHGFLRLEDGTLAEALDGTEQPSRVKHKLVVAQLPNTADNRKAYLKQIAPQWVSSPRRSQMDSENNTITFYDQRIETALFGNIRSWVDNPYNTKSDEQWRRKREEELLRGRTIGDPQLLGPVVAPGAAIGWLAAPIPILGAIGLLALLGVMGRRSVIHFAIYLVLAGAAMLATVTPFFVGQPASHLFNLNTMGLFDSPFPGFESLMMVGLGELLSDYMAATLILGLALSAGVPWLLTAMFLKPTQASRTQAGPEVAA